MKETIDVDHSRWLKYLSVFIALSGLSFVVVFAFMTYEWTCERGDSGKFENYDKWTERDWTSEDNVAKEHIHKNGSIGTKCGQKSTTSNFVSLENKPWCLRVLDHPFFPSFNSHVVNFFNTFDCKSTLLMFDKEKRWDTMTQSPMNSLLTMLIFMECGRHFGMARMGDGEICMARGVKYSAGVDRWNLGSGIGTVGKWINKYSLAVGDHKHFYYGHYIRWSSHWTEYHRQFPKVKKVLAAHMRQLVQHTMLVGTGLGFWQHWFEARLRPRLIPHINKVYVFCNRQGKPNKENILKWADKVWFFQDNEVAKLQNEEYAEKFKKIFIDAAKETENSLFLISIGPMAYPLIVMMMDANPKNTYFHAGSTLLKYYTGKPNYRAYENPKSRHFQTMMRYRQSAMTRGELLREHKPLKKRVLVPWHYQWQRSYISFDGCEKWNDPNDPKMYSWKTGVMCPPGSKHFGCLKP